MTTQAPLRGDEAELFHRHHRDVLRNVSRAVNAPPALIDDACQNAWLILLRRQPDRDTVRGWLITVAIREAYRLSSRERRTASLDEVLAEVLAGPEDVAETVLAHETHDQRRSALASLSPRKRQVLTLHAAGWRYKEIAAALGITYTNVNRHLTEGRALLRQAAVEV